MTLEKEEKNLQPVGQIQAWKEFLTPKFHRLAEFLASQGITTTGNLLYGFLCVRLLPISEYAQFAVVFGFLGALAILVDIGASSTLLPLIGERIGDCQLIADYVASLRKLSRWLYVVVAPALMVIFPIAVRRQGWNWHVVAFMVAILLVAVWCVRVGGAYGTVLIVRRDRTVWYRVQMISSLGKLALLGVLWSTHLLNAFSAMLISVGGIVFVSLALFIRARYLLGVKGHSSEEKRKEIIHLALPLMPNAIYYALQGQISLFLITIFGRTAAVASVGALGRLAQVFVLFGQMNPLFIEPYFAKLPRARLKRSYLGVLAVEGAISTFVICIAGCFPGLFLWVLGPKYSNLHFEVLLVIASSSISYLHGVMWCIHSARRFVYWWNNIAIIVLTLAVEIFFIWRVDLSTVRAVLTLNLTMAAVSLPVSIVTGIYGFMRGPRGSANMVPVQQEIG